MLRGTIEVRSSAIILLALIHTTLSCSPIFPIVTTAVSLAASTCYSLTDGEAYSVAQNVSMNGVSSSKTYVDLRDSAFLINVDSRASLALSNVTLFNTVLLPPIGVQGPLLPAAFHLESGGLLYLSRIRLQTTCSSVAVWCNFLGITNSTSGNDTITSVFSYVADGTVVDSVQLACNSDFAPVALATAASGVELQSLLSSLGPLSTPLSINLTSNDTVLSNWNQTHIESGLILQGSISSNILDMGASPAFLVLGTKSVSMQSLILTNGCVSFPQSMSSYEPGQLMALMTPFSSITAEQQETFASQALVEVTASVVEVQTDELAALLFWQIVISGSSSFRSLPSLNSFSQQISVQTLHMGSPPELLTTSFPLVVSSLNLSLMTGPSATYRHVLIVAKSNSSAPQVTCQSGALIKANDKAPINLYVATDSSSLNFALVTTAALPGGVLLVPGSPSSSYPPVLLLIGNCSLPSSSSSAISLTLTRDILISGPTYQQATLQQQQAGEFVTLDLSQATSTVTIASTTPRTRVYLQNLYLTGAAVGQVPLSGSSSGSVVRTALPLFAFSGDRTSSLIVLKNCQLQLSNEDYVQIYALAASSRGPTTSGNLLSQGISILNVSYFNSSSILFSQYYGWGLDASDLLVVPTDPTLATGLINTLSLLPPPPSPSNYPVVDATGSPSSSTSQSLVLGLAIGLGVGIPLLCMAAVAIWCCCSHAGGQYATEEDEESKDVEAQYADADAAAEAAAAAAAERAAPQLKLAPAPLAAAAAAAAAAGGCDMANSVRNSYDSPHYFQPNRGSSAKLPFLSPSLASVEEDAPLALPTEWTSDGNLALWRAMCAASETNTPAAVTLHQLLGEGVIAVEDAEESPTPPWRNTSSNSKQSSWDPHKEIKELSKDMSQEANKLVLLEPIGQGGFGTVYRGRWRNLEVAVKTILFSEQTGGASSSVADRHMQPQRRAIMEAAVCTSVMHDNVVVTYHYDITSVSKAEGNKSRSGMLIDEGDNIDWKLYLVQEYCNASLQDALRNQLLLKADTKGPDLDLVLSVLMDIARGMCYIHGKNIIHGDLTPGNVLLKQDPGSPIGVVGKITDFGLCNTIDPNKTHISNISNGTPFYVAPEVVSSGQLTKNSDVYSFGVLMWELYRGMPPWVKTETGYSLNRRFRRFPFDSPRIYVALCARCLDKSPKNRPGFSMIMSELSAMHAAYLKGYDTLEDPNLQEEKRRSGPEFKSTRESNQSMPAERRTSGEREKSAELPRIGAAIFGGGSGGHGALSKMENLNSNGGGVAAGEVTFPQMRNSQETMKTSYGGRGGSMREPLSAKTVELTKQQPEALLGGFDVAVPTSFREVNRSLSSGSGVTYHREAQQLSSSAADPSSSRKKAVPPVRSTAFVNLFSANDHSDGHEQEP
ncbi:hypothetical protein CEUSTIGMA_g12063.t1 [Chlamydomonas eustigma]|uniref:Protein kinase domain-containing protein n=1 Tax=Chlamydomonas eustigma TaxID=1157962 RepID=A0A250XNY9_9CHLO|nr:hypothetical protein CEUSTIGMA_g12063.t1 [Chlamydomonas eustigma]|eukprot:GAX84642.1 hypothetical protein CEUSTIGMA_g12063.t1 [Chlamydomonas eustigma]